MNTCPAPSCGKDIADTSFCCLTHWKQLPRGLRQRIDRAAWNGRVPSALIIRDAHGAWAAPKDSPNSLGGGR